MNNHSHLTNLSDSDLLAEVERLATSERQATTHLIASLMEVDVRRLYLRTGYSSLFTYCTGALHLSEHSAYRRIEAARAARRFPALLEFLESGALHLTAVVLLAPHLTDANHLEVLRSAHHKSKREVELLAAALRPQSSVPSTVRKLPASKAPEPPTTEIGPPPPVDGFHPMSDVATAPSRPAVVAPLAPERYKVQFTISKETLEKLRRVQDLLRHTIPNGDPAAVFDKALTVLLAELERTKLGAAKRGRTTTTKMSTSRHIPTAIKRAVWKRDGGQCAFAGTHGRCPETGCLEFHHVVPYADGGQTVVENIELRCRAHNAYEAEQSFGSFVIREARGWTRAGTSTSWNGSMSDNGRPRKQFAF